MCNIILSLLRKRAPHLAMLAWTVALVVSWCCITGYEFATEQLSSRAETVAWPIDSELAQSTRGATLLLFLHPQCPCSRASISELQRLFAELQRKGISSPTLYVIATLPDRKADGWLEMETVRQAAKLPGSRVVADRSGVEADRFGAVTSGTVMVFDAMGQRLYAGGVTVARGMVGDNAGRDAIENLLEGKAAALPQVPAFGCRLCLPHDKSKLAGILQAN